MVDTITFDSEELGGSVEITEYEDPPSLIQERVSRSIGATEAVDIGSTGDGNTDSLDVVSVAKIKPTTERAEESSATVQLEVDKSSVENPQQLSVIKEYYDFEAQKTRWKQLDTTVESTSGDTVTVSADVQKFSLFAIAETDGGSTAQTSDATPDSEEPESGSSSGVIIGVVIALAILAVAVVTYKNRK